MYHTAGILHSIVASLLQTYKVNKYGRSGKIVFCGLGFVRVGPVLFQSFCHALMLLLCSTSPFHCREFVGAIAWMRASYLILPIHFLFRSFCLRLTHPGRVKQIRNGIVMCAKGYVLHFASHTVSCCCLTSLRKRCAHTKVLNESAKSVHAHARTHTHTHASVKACMRVTQRTCTWTHTATCIYLYSQ